MCMHSNLDAGTDDLDFCDFELENLFLLFLCEHFGRDIQFHIRCLLLSLYFNANVCDVLCNLIFFFVLYHLFPFSSFVVSYLRDLFQQQ